MPCITKLATIRTELEHVYLLAPVMFDVLKLIFGPKRKISKKVICGLHADLYRIYSAVAVPSHERFHEVMRSRPGEPSQDCVSWCRNLLNANDKDPYETGALGSLLCEASGLFAQFVDRLPPRFRRELGEKFATGRQPWAVRCSLSADKPLANVPESLRQEIDSAGGPEQYVRSCTRWSELEPCIKSDHWEINWPDAGALCQTIQQVIEGFKRRGDEDFSTTFDEVVDAIVDIVEENTPPEFPVRSAHIDRKTQQKLDMGALLLPYQLTVNGIHNAVEQRFTPCETAVRHVCDALKKLSDEGRIHTRSIRCATPTAPVPCERQYIFPGPEPRRKGPRNQPSQIAFEAYRLHTVAGLSQRDIAKELSKEHGGKFHQGQVSRFLRQVTEFLAAGNELPNVQSSSPRQIPTDPAVLDRGRRVDARPPRPQDLRRSERQ